MKQIVVISDLHAHPWAAFANNANVPHRNSRLLRTLTVLKDSLEKARTLRVPWVFAGDLVHTAGYTLNAVLGELSNILYAYGDVPKVVVWGNHDVRGVGGRITLDQTVWSPLYKTPGLTILEGRGCVEVGGITFSGAGFQPQMDWLKLAEPSDVGVYHQTVHGSINGQGHQFDHGLACARLWKRHDLAVVGHVHHAQMFKQSGRCVLVPGSPEHHNFGDRGKHGWWIVDLDAMSLGMIEGGSPQFLTVDAPQDVRDDGNFYRVRTVPAGATLPQGIAVIAPGPTTVTSRDLALQGVSVEQAVDTWLRQRQADLPAARRIVREAGISLLQQQEVPQMRPATLERVELLNFCSHAESRLDVTPGTYLVLGRGRDYPSNGAGKSSLFEAVFWALFGRTTKGLSGNEVIRWGEKSCAVTVVFDLGGHKKLVVCRERTQRSSRLAVSAVTPRASLDWEAASVSEMTTKLQAFLGLTPELFQALGYFSQERLLLFASATDAERKTMLADLMGLTAYQAASTRAGEMEREAQKQQQTSDTAAQVYAESAARMQAQFEKLLNEAAEWQVAWSARRQRAEHDLNQFEQGAKQLLAEIVADTSQTVSLQARLAAKQEQHIAARDALAQMVEPYEPEAWNALWRKAQETLRSTDATLASKAAILRTREQEERDTVEVMRHGTCPTCRQAISEHQQQDVVTVVKALRQKAAHDVRRAGQRRDAALAEAQELERAGKQVQQVAELRKRIDTLEEDISALRERIDEKEGMATNHAKAEVSRRRQQLQDALRRIADEKNPLTARAQDASREAKAATVSERRARDAATLAQRQAAVWAFWAEGFSKQGLQSVLMDEVARLFNAERGSIFPALTQGVYDVQFSAVSQTKAGEWRERTEVLVSEHGQPVPYAALSGGQRRRIDVGVMLTLVKAVSRWLQVPGALGVLVLDEVFGFLDASGAEGLLEALREVQLMVPTVYVVSHDPQLQALIPDVIQVVQGADGTSTITAARGED